ncbi:MAG TPA: TadE/TadG family type IV pilus assembly protein [Candidatus Acidoferrales bacterium]|nr:TadE/TadG family type IV pilus assembly protein [Sporichthya sp.]HXI44765.1 TadE/TadG family type IV pilus assembly protein [Candidatus Acidoferrales bacterium]
MTEFAIIAPILFLLLFGVLQVGLLMGAQNSLTNSVRDAARRAATYRVNDQSFDPSIFGAVCDAVETNLVDHLSAYPDFDPALLTPTVSYEWKQTPDSKWFVIAHVSATYGYPVFVPLDRLLVLMGIPATGSWGPGHIQISASEQMRVENPPLTPTSPTTESCT